MGYKIIENSVPEIGSISTQEKRAVVKIEAEIEKPGKELRGLQPFFQLQESPDPALFHNVVY